MEWCWFIRFWEFWLIFIEWYNCFYIVIVFFKEWEFVLYGWCFWFCFNFVVFNFLIFYLVCLNKVYNYEDNGGVENDVEVLGDFVW